MEVVVCLQTSARNYSSCGQQQQRRAQRPVPVALILCRALALLQARSGATCARHAAQAAGHMTFVLNVRGAEQRSMTCQ